MRLWVIAGLAVGLTGCVSSGDMDLLHREITDVSRQVENLGRQSTGKDDIGRHEPQAGRAVGPGAQVQRRHPGGAPQAPRPDPVPPGRARLHEPAPLGALQRAGGVSRAGRPRPASADRPDGRASRGAPPPAGGPRGNEPTQLYNAAYEDYLRSNFDLAIQGFREYAKRYPSTDLADNALYWVGESYYSKKQFKEAIDAFTELLNTYKSSDKAAAGLLKKGLAYLEMGDRSQAVINLQYVLYEHPGSKEADLARARLQALGVKVK